MSMKPDERRRHVRIRPVLELPAKLLRVDRSPEEALEVFDVSIRGIGIVTAGSMLEASRDEVVRARLDLGRYGVHEIETRIRHVGTTLTGSELDEPSPGVTTALGRYLAELLERGAFS
jgi:hypothetical protein